MSATLASKGVSIVLVHGGFVDGSGWQGVYNILKMDGYNVSIVQNPTISLGDDVAVTKRVLAAQPGPVVLVGHSYGGVAITEAGNDPKVAGLVYIAAFAPDRGESVSALIAVQNPLTSLRDDVDTVTRAINHQTNPIVLVGQGYGGTVITQAGNHPRVAALVYVAAFAPDAGESTTDAYKCSIVLLRRR